ncbi:MAG: hypothetical protein JSR33_04975 [Proteobacteria bacterium]|nr:hypothetical protein [Pseudomonadota bacterium]
MILVEIAFCLGLLALIGGGSLYLWSVRAEAGPGIIFAKSLGLIVVILSILSLIASLLSGVGMRKMYHQLRNTTTVREQNNTSSNNNSQVNTQATAPQNTAAPTSSTSNSNSNPNPPAANS